MAPRENGSVPEGGRDLGIRPRRMRHLGMRNVHFWVNYPFNSVGLTPEEPLMGQTVARNQRRRRTFHDKCNIAIKRMLKTNAEYVLEMISGVLYAPVCFPPVCLSICGTRLFRHICTLAGSGARQRPPAPAGTSHTLHYACCIFHDFVSSVDHQIFLPVFIHPSVFVFHL